MRIGLVIYGSLDTLSGGYLYDRKLVEYLRACGDSVEIVSLPWRSYPRHLLDNFSPAWNRRLAGLDVDLLLQDELNHQSLAWANRTLRDSRFPIVSIVHHLRSSEEHLVWLLPFYRWVEQCYLASVDGFICNSRTTQKTVDSLVQKKSLDTDLQDSQDFDPPPSAKFAFNSFKPSIFAYPAADHLDVPASEAVHRLIDERNARSGPVELLFVGNLIPRKGLHHLLAALAHLPNRNWRLHAVGRTDVDFGYSARIRAEIEGLGLGDTATLHGRVSDAALTEHLNRCHLLAVPSYEGFGIVYLEAMAFGLPVIASTAGAAHEIVQPGVNGFLVEPANTGGLAQTL
ncbi:MAG: glycosyltransferase family 4 protein, partial [Chloroflexi bacterium]|nr:glycosyltransferase family 4 protein [Chloroflexota bacterium]